MSNRRTLSHSLIKNPRRVFLTPGVPLCCTPAHRQTLLLDNYANIPLESLPSYSLALLFHYHSLSFLLFPLRYAAQNRHVPSAGQTPPLSVLETDGSFAVYAYSILMHTFVHNAYFFTMHFTIASARKIAN